MTGKLRLLDLYCDQGGASKGYADAGFVVTGLDIVEQPRYPYGFIHGDAIVFIKYLREFIRENFDAIAASPPCQRYSKTQRIQSREHPDLIAPTRESLDAIGLPYVIENVEDAREELKDPVMLCGASFGIRTYRHRLFEAGNGFCITVPEHPPHDRPNAKMGRPVYPWENMHIVGNFSNTALAREIMGMPWASREGLREAIPPVYTEYIGRQLKEYMEGMNSNG